jgi:hypothetical protein
LIQGYFVGDIQRPACSPWVGAPTQWAIASQPYKQNPQAQRIEILEAFPNHRSPIFGADAYQKPILLRGRLRLYSGPQGCPISDSHGQYQYDRLPQLHLWYFVAVELQSTAELEWFDPRAPIRAPVPTNAPANLPTTLSSPIPSSISNP